MVVTNKKATSILLGFIVLIGQMQNAFAEMMQKGRTKLKVLANLYHQNSNDGAQVVDNFGREEANVFEPMIFIEHQINENTAINGNFVFDAWSAASDTKLDTYTGASGGSSIANQARVSGTFGVRQEYGSTEWHSSFGFSSEYDYRSFNGAVGASKGFAQDNFTLGLDLRYYADAVKLFTDISPASTARISDFLPRQILNVSLSASQILTVKDIVQLSLDFIRATNNLESTASTVLVNGTRESEDLPETRARYATGVKWVHGVGDTSALHLNYRYYFDQWGADAHTIGANYYWSVRDEQDLIELSTRFHKQTKVDYYADSFSAAHQGFKTSDSDLEDFSSYEVGLAYDRSLGDKKLFGIDLENVFFNNGVTYANRTNGLSYAFWQSSFAFEF